MLSSSSLVFFFGNLNCVRVRVHARGRVSMCVCLRLDFVFVVNLKFTELDNNNKAQFRSIFRFSFSISPALSVLHEDLSTYTFVFYCSLTPNLAHVTIGWQAYYVVLSPIVWCFLLFLLPHTVLLFPSHTETMNKTLLFSSRF